MLVIKNKNKLEVASLEQDYAYANFLLQQDRHKGGEIIEMSEADWDKRCEQQRYKLACLKAIRWA